MSRRFLPSFPGHVSDLCPRSSAGLRQILEYKGTKGEDTRNKKMVQEMARG